LKNIFKNPGFIFWRISDFSESVNLGIPGKAGRYLGVKFVGRAT
jgi:hypothetical protein